MNSHAELLRRNAGVFSGYQWFLSVGGQVERAYVGLAPLELHHPLLSRQALIQSVHSHYMRTALPGLLQVLANADVLGKLPLCTTSETCHLVRHSGATHLFTSSCLYEANTWQQPS